MTAQRYRFYTGGSSILNISDLEQTSDNLDSIPLYSTESKLMSCMKSGDEAGVLSTINEIFNSFSPDKKLPVDYIKSICIELVCMASRSLYELQENIGSIICNRSKILENIYKIETLLGLKEYKRSISVTQLHQSHIQKGDRNHCCRVYHTGTHRSS